MRDIKKEMQEVKCGDFQSWYINLTSKEKEIYRKEFNKLQIKYE